MPQKKLSKEERKRALRDRTSSNIKNKDSAGNTGKRVIDLSNYDDVAFYKPKKGTNKIDILPFLVSTDKHPQGMKPGYEDYLLDIWVHGWVGPAEDSFVCLKKTYGKPCPICEEIAAMLQSESPNKKLINSIKAKRRCYYNVIDLEGDEDDKIKLFEVSHYLFEKELLEEAETAEEEVIIFSDLEDGRSIRFRASQDQMEGKEFLKFKSFTFEKRRKPYKEGMLEQTYPLDALLVIPSYDEVKNSFFGVDDDQDKGRDDDQDDDDDSPREKSSHKREERSGKSRCPHGYKFGADCDEQDECADCDAWEKCADERDKLNERD